MTDIPRAIRVDVKIVSFVRRFRSAYDRGPSLGEIGLELGAATRTSVSRAVGRLVAAGRLVRKPDGPDVPGNVDAAVSLLEREGFTVIRPDRNLERNGNYSAPVDMVQMLSKLD